MNSAVFNQWFCNFTAIVLRGCGQNAMVTFDMIAVSFEVSHVMHRGDLLFIMADRVCGVLKVLLSPSYGS